MVMYIIATRDIWQEGIASDSTRSAANRGGYCRSCDAAGTQASEFALAGEGRSSASAKPAEAVFACLSVSLMASCTSEFGSTSIRLS